MNDRQWINEFVGRMWALAPPDRPAATDRAVLARLRRGLGKPVAATLSRDGELFDGVPDDDLDTAVLIAGLFAEHPQFGQRGSLGRAFREFRGEAGGESVEKRFAHLVDSDTEDLPERLRQAVKLLAAKGIPVDWSGLLDDVLNWDDPDRRVQRAWARDFWREIAPPPGGTHPEPTVP